jgi:hypothetical protein
MAWKRALWIAPALMLAGCLNGAQNKAADDATAQFYQRMAAKQYAAIYDDAAPSITTTIGRDAFVGVMQGIDEHMGACQAPTKAARFNTNINNGVTTHSQGYVQVCANGKLQETVITVIEGGKAKIAGYLYREGDIPPDDNEVSNTNAPAADANAAAPAPATNAQ